MVETMLGLMTEAFEGDPEIWLPINVALRDAMVSSAARRSPYYERVAAGVGEFEDLPLLTKDLIREHRDELLARGIAAERRVEKTTSGSTGDPLVFVKDLWFSTAETAACLFLKRLHGVPLDAVEVLITFHPVEERQADETGRPLRSADGAPIVRVPRLRAIDELPAQLEHWASLGAYWLYSTASLLEELAAEILGRRLAVPAPPIACVTTGDNLTPHGAEQIARAFETVVHSWYGSSELSGYVAGTVPGGEWGSYACNPWLSYVEITDDSGRCVPAGEPGRLVLTDLHNHAMPFIRYDTGDTAALSPSTIGGFRVLSGLAGRSSEERIRLRGGRVITPASLGSIFEERVVASAVSGWQCRQLGPDAIELRLVWVAGEDAAVVEAVERLAQEMLDPDTYVSIRTVDRLDTLPSGKRWLVMAQ